MRDRLQKIVDAAKALSAANLDAAIEACGSQNLLPEILDSSNACKSITGLPKRFTKAIREYFGFGFELLSPLGIRDEQYRVIHEAIASKVCPFCGYEFFSAPGSPRHHLDHYLPISLYPFAGANLKNLVPMGPRCNSSYKLADDILFEANGNRRTAFDPYGNLTGSVNLLGSQFYDEAGEIRPNWVVNLGVHSAASTWDEVWNIRSRYRSDVFSVEYESWLSDFGNWCVYAGRPTNSDAEILDALEAYTLYLGSQRFADRAFLKKAFFDLLISLATDAEVGERTKELLKSVVEFSEA